MHSTVAISNAAAMLLAVLTCAGCAGQSASPPQDRAEPGWAAGEAASSTRAYHRLSLVGLPGQSNVNLSFDRGQASAPRVVEVFLRPTPNLKLVKSEAGDSLIAAGKQAIFRQTDDGLIRVVAYSASNTETLDTGVLAELQFERTGDGPAQIEIVKDRPLLAPSGANAGLEIGAPLKL